jgi:hypothetical protein
MTTHDAPALATIRERIDHLRADIRRLPPIGNVPTRKRPAAAARLVALYNELVALTDEADFLGREQSPDAL